MIHKFTYPFYVAALLINCSSELIADESKPAVKPVKKLILPGESFLLDGRPAFILWPPKEKRQQPQPWIMYSPTLAGTPDSHEKWMHEQFLAAGVAVAGIDVGEAYGSPEGQKYFAALYRELTKERGFATKPCLLGRSRGGLWASSWAIRNTDKVAGFAGIYPVLDLRTYPGLNRAAPAYGLKVEELRATLDEHNPIAKIEVLAKAEVPVFIIHGDIDKVVPLKENSATLVERYKQANAEDLVKLVVVEGQGHNFFPGFFRCQQLVDFAIRQAKSSGIAPTADNSRSVYETEINAGIDDVWTAFSTNEGLRSWMAPLVEIDLIVGGLIKANYNPDGKIGDENTIENTILAYDPKRMLSLKATKFPKGFPFVEAAKESWSVFYFSEISPAQTKITIVGLGYTDDEQSQKMHSFFEAANKYSMDKLNESLTTSPEQNTSK